MPHKLDTDQHVYFYENEFYVLSNFSAFTIYYRGLDFDTAEQAYHWAKFAPPGIGETIPPASAHAERLNYDIRSKILHSRSAHDALKIAEEFAMYRRQGWEALRLGVMRDILRCKVAQHEYVYRKLMETGERELIEDSWRDSFWGWGPERDGTNALGKLWMELRTELRAKA